MKPGNATVASMAKAILDFETSTLADQRRQIAFELESMTQDLPAEPSRARIRHRELRRMARRMAYLALEELAKNISLREDQTQLLLRIQRLEKEIDRLDPHCDR